MVSANSSTEMRSSVLNPLYHLRRAFDYVLTRVWPSVANPVVPRVAFSTPRVHGWTALYDLVTFRPDVPYSEALRREAYQKSVVHALAWTSGTAIVAVVGLAAFRSLRR